MGNSDSQAHFKNNISGFFEKNLSEMDNAYWIEMIRIPYSFDDIYAAVSPAMVRDLLSKHPENVLAVIKVCKELIWKGSKEGEGDFHRNIVLNAVRLVSRIIPILLENQEIRATLWESGVAFGIVDGLMGLLFRYNFGINIVSNLSPYDVDPGRIWKEGIYSSIPQNVSYEISDENRVETLRCILSCCSQTLYADLSTAENFINPWTWLFSSYEIRHCKDAFYSLFNTALGFSKEGFGLFSSQSASENEASLAAQVLIVLLDSKVPEIHAIENNEELSAVYNILLEIHNGFVENSSIKTQLKLGNVFLECLKEIEDTEQFDFIINSFVRHFGTIIDSMVSYLSITSKDIVYFQELLILFWYLIDFNTNFKEAVIKHQEFHKIIDLLLVIIWHNHETLTKAGIVQLSIFIILHFSSEREFSIQMAKPYQNHLPINIIGLEYYFDILINIFHTIIVGNPNLTDTISTFMIILLNLSPHIKKIGNSSSLKLFALFEHFSAKKFIYKDKKNANYLYQILDVFNNRLQYQWDGSLYLVYAIISKKSIIDKFINLQYEPPIEPAWDISEEWFTNFKNNLPIGLLIALYTDLLPRIEKLCSKNSQIIETEIIDFLKKTTMVGIFPVPHILYLRKFHSTRQTINWLSSLIWGTIYSRNSKPQIFDYTTIKLFIVSSN
ncbi:unnamed protein product [Blepharisma stoltei]|uniref:Uncharacterized protein n=1 Tax=Blepharisma stoltei TaxID=1481888 RepID=A0AAU9JY05_9CILI|nr:unnamed protein product [Blepharisma stoltei]